MSLIRRDESPETGRRFELDMGVDGRFMVDVFRAHEPLLKRWHEQVLVELGGLRCSDEKYDSIAIALDVADAKVLMGVLRQAVEFIESERQARDTKRKESQ